MIGRKEREDQQYSQFNSPRYYYYYYYMEIKTVLKSRSYSFVVIELRFGK